jgi:N-acyl-D-amino-acid deacylase
MRKPPLGPTVERRPRLSRRRVLKAAAGFAAWNLAGARAARAAPATDVSVTGVGEPKLAAYDALMTDFMRQHQPPGAALAVSRDGRLVYARGFGFADLERREPAQPLSLFRIASLSKPFTATAVMQLVQQRKLRLDDKVTAILKVQPFLERGARIDPRIHAITVQHCLQHTAGWDRTKGFDPMAAVTAELIAHQMGVGLPMRTEHIVRYSFGRPLDFDPGTRFAYSNFGYCVLGRVIAAVSGLAYHDYVQRHVLAPLGISRMRLGRNLLADRAAGEVKYYDSRNRTGRAISGPQIGRQVPLPYGVECLETMDANGAWIASPVMLTRFIDSFNDIRAAKLLDETSVRTMYARPPGEVGLAEGRPRPTYYGFGWNVRPVGARFTRWHGGLLAGSSTFLLGRADGINWAVTFNKDAPGAGQEFVVMLDAPLHRVADQIKDWPTGDLYPTFSL